MLKFMLTDKDGGILVLLVEALLMGLWMATREVVFQFAAGMCAGLMFARLYTRRDLQTDDPAAEKEGE